MRTTLNLDDDLLEQARQCTGVREKTRLLHLGLEALIQRAAGAEGGDSVSPKRKPKYILPVSSATGGLAPGFADLKEAMKALDIEADLRKLGEW